MICTAFRRRAEQGARESVVTIQEGLDRIILIPDSGGISPLSRDGGRRELGDRRIRFCRKFGTKASLRSGRSYFGGSFGKSSRPTML